MALTSIWLAVLGATSGLGALLDAFTRKLPNWLCVAMALAGLTFGYLLDGWTGLGLHALHGVLAFGIGFLLFSWGVFGGGDGKFYAASATFFPATKVLMLFVAMTFAGFLLALVWFAAKRGFKIRQRSQDDFAKLPYGMAIAMGSLALAFYTLQ